MYSLLLMETTNDMPFRYPKHSMTSLLRRLETDFINLDYFDLVEIPLVRLLGYRLYLYSLTVVC